MLIKRLVGMRLATGWTVRGLNPHVWPALRPTQPPLQWVPFHSRG